MRRSTKLWYRRRRADSAYDLHYVKGCSVNLIGTEELALHLSESNNCSSNAPGQKRKVNYSSRIYYGRQKCGITVLFNLLVACNLQSFVMISQLHDHSRAACTKENMQTVTTVFQHKVTVHMVRLTTVSYSFKNQSRLVFSKIFLHRSFSVPWI